MALRDKREIAWRMPLAGAVVVFRHRRRSARPARVALGVCGLLAATGALYALLRFALFGRSFVTGLPELLRAALAEALIAQAVVLLVSAAVLGAAAAPPRESEEEIQAALLASVSPAGLCLGRLLAALVSPVLALTVMCLLWLGVQARYGFQPADQGGCCAVLSAHLVLLCAILMVEATGLLLSLKRRPGREAWRGIAAGILLTVLCPLGLFLVSTQTRGTENPVPAINVLLLSSPFVAAETALHRDALRWSWVYDRVPVADYEFSYPSPWAACGVYIGAAAVAVALSAVRLRHAYR